VLSLAKDTDRALRSYQELGYHIEHGVWSERECLEFIEASHELSSYKAGSFVPVMHPHRTDPRFERALKHPRIVQAMERLLGGKVSGLQTELFFCRPGTQGFSLHQDGYYVEAKPDAFGSAWSALEDTSAENGGLVVYPRSHLESYLPVRIATGPPMPHQDPNARRVEAILPPGYEAVHIAVPRGAVVFLHACTVHGSNTNKTTNRFRHVLLSTYLRQGESFRPGDYAQRTEVDVYR
jgi:ectoine hydroxylase-related dioxygenase (phytanoyl-CoA dioxygenase family)